MNYTNRMLNIEANGDGWRTMLDYEALTDRLGSTIAERVWDTAAIKGIAYYAGVHYLRGEIGA